MSIIAAFGLVALVALVLLLLPYSPLEVEDLDIMGPSEVCPDEVVSTRMDYTLERPIDLVRATPVWKVVEVEDVQKDYIQEGENGDIPGRYFRVGSHTLTSPLSRFAPRRSGKWVAGKFIYVKGTSFGVPRTQRLEVYEETVTTVLPATDAECIEEGP